MIKVKREEKLDNTSYRQWQEITPYLITFHMKYKENVFGLQTYDLSNKYMLALIRQPNAKILYKDRLENTHGKGKYSFAKALNTNSTIHFYHHKCEIKIINSVTTSFRFFQQNIHVRDEFGSKFAIHAIPDPRPFKHYLYFDFFDFFNYYQQHKLSFTSDIGRGFYSYLSDNNTEIFTTFEKFQNEHQGRMDYKYYFLVHPTGHQTCLKYPNSINFYVPETLINVLEKEQNEEDRIFNKDFKHKGEEIYIGMKANVEHYGVKPFYTEYEHLDNFYYKISFKDILIKRFL